MPEKIKKNILDTLFPIFCASCQKEGGWLCDCCFSKMPIPDTQFCPKCEKEITLSGLLCPNCRFDEKFYLDALVSAASFDDPCVKKLVYGFKYGFLKNLSGILARIILRALRQSDLRLPSVIVPVPLHPRRLRRRGYNQAELLSQKLSRLLAPMLPIPVLDILKRKKYNKPQMEIRNFKERLANVSDLFEIKARKNSEALKEKTVLLLDDIATTGATLNECARVLKENGAKKVFAAVIARQTLKK